MSLRCACDRQLKRVSDGARVPPEVDSLSHFAAQPIPV